MAIEEKRTSQRVTIYFKSELFRKLKVLAVERDEDVSSLVNQAVSDYLERNKKSLQKIAAELVKD